MYFVDFSSGIYEDVFYSTKVFTEFSMAKDCFDKIKGGKYDANYAWMCSTTEENGEVVRKELLDTWFNGKCRWAERELMYCIKDTTDYSWASDSPMMVARARKERKIVTVDSQKIEFDDGTQIVFDHDTECCEYNYADFEQLDDLARTYTFRGDISFETVDRSGFRFGDGRQMFFVPCYSEQNGYYSSNLDVYWRGPFEEMLCHTKLRCEGVYRD